MKSVLVISQVILMLIWFFARKHWTLLEQASVEQEQNKTMAVCKPSRRHQCLGKSKQEVSMIGRVWTVRRWQLWQVQPLEGSYKNGRYIAPLWLAWCTRHKGIVALKKGANDGLSWWNALFHSSAGESELYILHQILYKIRNMCMFDRTSLRSWLNGGWTDELLL